VPGLVPVDPNRSSSGSAECDCLARPVARMAGSTVRRMGASTCPCERRSISGLRVGKRTGHASCRGRGEGAECFGFVGNCLRFRGTDTGARSGTGMGDGEEAHGWRRDAECCSWGSISRVEAARLDERCGSVAVTWPA